jgi:hypothetical protein
MKNTTLPLVVLPDAAEFLKTFQAKAKPPGVGRRLHWDSFCRKACSCGRHTYGPVNEKAWTKEMVDDPWMRRDDETHTWWSDHYRGVLEMYAATHAKHDAEGRVSEPCVNCTCKTMMKVADPSLVQAGHHQVCDFTRSCWDRTDPDQYLLPAGDKVLWQEMPYCKHMVSACAALSEEVFLIERVEGFWIYIYIHNCSATPDFRCDTNFTHIHWSDDFDFIWNQCMTQGVRQMLWRVLSPKEPVSPPHDE